MKFLIAGDLVVNQPHEINIDESVLQIFESSDFRIVNLEAPVTDSSNKQRKTGPNLRSNRKGTLSVLKTLDVNLVTLANNHLLDYGEQGVSDSISFCRENLIGTVGGGMNREEASRVYYCDTSEGKIAIINIAENEWASATDSSAGANGMELIDDVKQIKEAKLKSNFVFVIVHGGHEFFNLPSPRMQKQYRYYVDSGADLVVGHHSHCISGAELYNGRNIYYSLGNFLFTQDNKFEGWYYGMILQVEIKDGVLRTSHHFVTQEKKVFNLSLVTGDFCVQLDRKFDEFSSVISSSLQLQASWLEFVSLRKEAYSNYWSPISFIRNRYIRGLLGRLNLRFTNKHALALYLNLLRCEAHRDLSQEIIVKYLKK